MKFYAVFLKSTGRVVGVAETFHEAIVSMAEAIKAGFDADVRVQYWR